MNTPKQYRMLPFKKAFNIKLIDKYVDRVLAKLREHYNTSPTGSEFDKLVNDWWEALDGTKIPYQAMYASVLDLAGKELTRDIIKYTTWRLIGNLPRLMAGVAVPPWTQQTLLEWVSIKLVRAQPGRSTKGKMGFWYDYRIHNGQAAGLRFRLFWSLKYIRFLANSLGLKYGRKADYRLVDGAELVGMRLYLLLDPELNKEDGPGAYHFHVPASCKTANKEILKQRKRQIPCPENYTLTEMPCFKCYIGYDKCKAACHPFTYTVKACPRCQALRTWFDPAGRGVICVECEEKELIGVKGD